MEGGLKGNNLRLPTQWIPFPSGLGNDFFHYSSSSFVHRFVIQVYVEGHEVPPNAVLGGVDRKGPWYIARSFYEVRYLPILHNDLNLTLIFVGFNG